MFDAMCRTGIAGELFKGKSFVRGSLGLDGMAIGSITTLLAFDRIAGLLVADMSASTTGDGDKFMDGVGTCVLDNVETWGLDFESKPAFSCSLSWPRWASTLGVFDSSVSVLAADSFNVYIRTGGFGVLTRPLATRVSLAYEISFLQDFQPPEDFVPFGDLLF